jgi:hypothetical protein
VHVHVPVHRALYLDRLSPVALLSVKLTAVNRLDLHHITLLAMAAASIVGRGDDCLSGRVETEVGLVHQLIIERRVDRCVIVLDSLGVVVVVVASLINLGSVFEQLVQNGLLLVVVNVHTLALDSTTVGSKRKNISYTFLSA